MTVDADRKLQEQSPPRIADIHSLRSQLVDKELIYFAAISPLAAALSLSRILEHGWHSLYLLHIGLVGVLIAIAVLRKRMSYHVRAGLLLGFILILGVMGLPAFGLVGGALLVLFTFAVMTAIAFGTRAGLIACAIDLAVVVGTGIAVCMGKITFEFDITHYALSPTGWGAVVTVFIMYVPVTVIALGVVQKNLSTSLMDLRESHAKNERLINNLVDTFLYRHDLEGLFDYVSPSVTQVLGYSTQEFLTHFSEYLTDHPVNQEVVKHTEKSMAGNQQPPYELQIYHKDGSIRWLEVAEVPVRDESGKVVLVEGVAHDITDRKGSEDALRESEAKYRTFFENSVDAMLMVWDYQFVDCNTAAVAMLGYEGKKELLNTHPWELSPEYQPDGRSSRDKAMDIIEIALSKGTHRFEWNHKRKNGEVFPVEVTLTAIPEERGVMLHTVWRDITDRKCAEAELERFALVIEQTDFIVVITDTDGDIVYVNPAFEKVTGYSREEVLGRNPRILKSGKVDPEVYRVLWATITGGNTWKGQFINKKKDGTFYTEDATVSPLRDASGEVVNFVAAKRDITRELELEDQLFQSQKMEAVGQLAGGVAHDFNNLLQAILGYGEMMSDMVQEGPAHESLDQIMKAGDRAKTLVGQLLAFSRRQVLQTLDLNLNEVIADLLKMIQRVIGEHVVLDFLPGEDIGTVHADRGRIAQILTNLCVNARDAMPEGGTITIETENVQIDQEYCESHAWDAPGKYVMLRVADTGCGMNEETLSHAFEPFFTTKSLDKGTGLGLSTVYGLVRQHNGQIEASSEVGKGTTFKIYLPVIERAATSVSDQVEASVSGGTETILLAEDDEMVLRLCRSILEREGYTVLPAVDGVDALRVFDEHADVIDLAILDVVMPNLGGRAVFEQIREKRPDIKVLFSSGYSANAVHTNFILDEGLMLIQKPYQRGDLLRKVREVLSRE